MTGKMRRTTSRLDLKFTTIVAAAIVAGCSDSTTPGAAEACRPETVSVDVQVNTGSSVTFDWSPACPVALLLVEEDGSDQWLISGFDLSGDPELTSNRIVPPVTYGIAPSTAVDSEQPAALVTGRTYELVLWRALPPGSTAPCQMRFGNACAIAIRQFVR